MLASRYRLGVMRCHDILFLELDFHEFSSVDNINNSLYIWVIFWFFIGGDQNLVTFLLSVSGFLLHAGSVIFLWVDASVDIRGELIS